MKVPSVLFVMLMLSSACAPQQAETTSPPHWTYEGEQGPAHWGELDTTYAVCGTGKSQSPIDVASPSEQDLTNISFHYRPSAVNILNNGHTVQVNYDAGSYIELDNVRYDVVQFHYHAPSEHTVDGESFPAELHIVHRNADGNLAVVGILLREGTENAAYQPFIGNLPTEKNRCKRCRAENQRHGPASLCGNNIPLQRFVDYTSLHRRSQLAVDDDSCRFIHGATRSP